MLGGFRFKSATSPSDKKTEGGLTLDHARGGVDIGAEDWNGLLAASMSSVADTSVGEAGVRYVARQPILDVRGRIRGYELLFRNAPTGSFAGNGDQATRMILDDLVMFDVQQFTGGTPAFINCTQDSLMGGLVAVATPETTVLEILETIDVTPGLVDTCRELQSAGYRIALDDFEWRPEVESLVELADYIKVDFVQTRGAERHAMLDRLRGSRAVLLAEKIETRADFEHAVREGFALFQGYYFCRPELISKREIPANLPAQMELMRVLHEGEMEFREMARLVKQDPSLTYRLLRMVNSAAFGLRREVRSVEMALIAVGEGTFRRIVMLAVTASFCPTKSWEALRMALVRARFCELGAAESGDDPREQYLLGLFSLLPAMLHVPMAQALAKISLSGGMLAALLGAYNDQAWLLRWMECHERGDWQQCDRIAEMRGLDARKLNRCGMESVVWADAMLHPMG